MGEAALKYAKESRVSGLDLPQEPFEITVTCASFRSKPLRTIAHKVGFFFFCASDSMVTACMFYITEPALQQNARPLSQ